MKSFSFSSKIALRYLWSKRSEAFITILTLISVVGVAIGVGVITTVMSIMSGFEYELREKIVGTNSHIVVRSIGGKIDHWKEVADEVKKVDGVDSVSAFTYHQALVRVEDRSTGILIRGIERGSSAAQQLIKYMEGAPKPEELFAEAPVNVTDEGGNPAVVQLGGLIVGRELTRTLKIFLGEPVSLLSPNVTSTPFGLVPRYKRFVVNGVYKSGLTEYEGGLAYMALEEAQKFFRMGDAVSGYRENSLI